MIIFDQNKLESGFPNLKNTQYCVKSNKDNRYNCFAWALGYNNRSLPEDISYENAFDLDVYILLFKKHNFQPCSSDNLEEGFEKVAIYAKDNIPTHAARQLPSGLWSSKLGKDIDIEHMLNGLEDSEYGKVCIILKNPLKS